MIIEVVMYGCKCDNCGKEWCDEDSGYVAFTDKASMQQNISEEFSWYTEGDRHYCPKCWTVDEEDNVITHNKPKQEAP